MLSLPYLFFLLFLSPLFIHHHPHHQTVCAAASTRCHVDDETGLLGFKSGISADPSGILQSWKRGTDCCTWSGISCTQQPNKDNRVTTITLSGQPDKRNGFLSGQFSPSISKLKYLNGIYLDHFRNITGTFPSSLFTLPNLEYIYITNLNNKKKLSGRLPDSIGKMTQLAALSLAGNGFTGQIPNSISGLTQLIQLNLGGNLFTGQMPSGIGRLTNLTLLNLSRNKFSGKIPDIFSSLGDLRVLDLSHNQFSGKIPATISSLAPKLIDLVLGHNGLTGTIPDFLGKFQTLDTMDLSWNRLSGIVPKTFGNLTKIFNLDLSHNLLKDPFPEMKVKGIESLDLSYNGFNLGQIPKWVSSSPIIYSLKLAKCGLKFKLEDWKPTVTYFYDYIDLSENQITGTPIGLLNSTDFLVGFWAFGNRLRFNLERMRFVKSLKDLDLSRNLVEGKVPPAISGLKTVNLSHNHLCGKLPATSFPASSFVGNDCLCGSPLPACKV